MLWLPYQSLIQAVSAFIPEIYLIAELPLASGARVAITELGALQTNKQTSVSRLCRSPSSFCRRIDHWDIRTRPYRFHCTSGMSGTACRTGEKAKRLITRAIPKITRANTHSPLRKHASSSCSCPILAVDSAVHSVLARVVLSNVITLVSFSGSFV